jgi:hypothetical protein
MGILDHFEKIISISQEHGIEKCLYKGKTHLAYVTGKLGISPIQAVLFSHLLEKSYNNHIDLGEIAESIKCSKIRMLKYSSELEELEKKKLIRCRRGDGDISYRIPHEVSKSLQKFNEYKQEKKDNLTFFKFFSALAKLYEIRANNEYSYDTLKYETFDLINQNMHLAFCQEIMRYDLRKRDIMLFILFCLLFWKNSDDNIVPSDFEYLYDGLEEDFIGIRSELTEGKHPLMRKRYIEYTNNNGFEDTERWKLTDAEKHEFLSEQK